MEEKEKYNGWLISNNIIKRSFAVFGYLTLAQILIVIMVLILSFVFGIFIGIIGALL